MTCFDRFVAIDWTGARGERHRAIQVAACTAGDGAPQLITPDKPWSRTEVLALLQGFADRGERVLAGIDCSFSLPFADHGAYFPDAADDPPGPRELWQEIDDAADPHLAAHGYIDRRRAHFWCSAADGPQRPYARLRVAEAVHKARGLGNPASPYVLVGPSQVGKATLSGMRLLARLRDMPVWPFDPLPAAGPCLVEIYCQAFAMDAGIRGKIRERAALDAALLRLGSRPVGHTLPDRFDDHVSDALIAAAGLRRATRVPAYWTPADITPEIAAYEGWTFGVP